MSFNSSNITGLNNDDKFLARYRNKRARTVYRAAKTAVVTKNLIKPLGYALGEMATYTFSGSIRSTAFTLGQKILAYGCGYGVLYSAYNMISNPGKIKDAARLAYNLYAVPMTFYSLGVQRGFDVLGFSYLETIWFGAPVPIFDGKVFVEGNFTDKVVADTIFDNINCGEG